MINKAKVLSFVLVIALLLVTSTTVVAQDSMDEKAKPILFKALLTPIDSSPPVSEDTPHTAIGYAVLLLNADKTKLHYTVSYKGLSGEPILAHFHTGSVTSAGGPVRTIFGKPEIEGAPVTPPKGTVNTISGVWSADDDQPLTEERVDQLLSNRIYINIHTPLNKSGEIQGLVVPIS